MKNTIKIIFCLFLLFIILWLCFIVWINPSRSYGERERNWYRAEIAYKKLSTDDLIRISESRYESKDKAKVLLRFFKTRQYPIVAEKVLASRRDPRAIKKLSEIVFENSDNRIKWDVIGEIGDKKNKAMVPVLCVALKRHTNAHTDWLIVDALNKIDDPLSLDCLVNELDKLRYKHARESAEEVIARWEKEERN